MKAIDSSELCTRFGGVDLNYYFREFHFRFLTELFAIQDILAVSAECTISLSNQIVPSLTISQSDDITTYVCEMVN